METAKGKQLKKNLDTRKHISFSELKKWTACPYARYLSYHKKLKLFTGNSYTAFGEAVHKTIEEAYEEGLNLVQKFTSSELGDYFEQNLKESLSGLSHESRIVKVEDPMPTQGRNIFESFQDEFVAFFGEQLKVFSIEEELYELVDLEDLEGEYHFKGFIDMVLVDENGQYHIIDWKTCSWGWDMKKRTDPMVVYQLTLYKHFFSKKHGIDPSKISTHFGLLKRTASKNRVEIFTVTNQARRTKNALVALDRAVKNIQSGPPIKNRLSCKNCEYYKTEHCA